MGGSRGAGQGSVASAEQGVSRARAEWTYASNNLHRVEPLLVKQFVTFDEVDRARTSEVTQAESLKQAESQLRQAEAALKSTIAQEERSKAVLTQSKAQHGQAQNAVTTLEPLVNQRGAKVSAIETARYNLNNCRVYAPFDARVTNLTISEGAYAHTGQQMFTLIDARTWWAVANFREGQLQRMTGRLVDLAATLPPFASQVSAVDHERIDEIANRIAQIRHDLENKKVPLAADPAEIDAWQGLPLLGEIEKAVALIPGVFSGSQSLRIFDPSAPADGDPQPAATRSTWFSSEHLKFGLKGCLAASLCYIIYSAVAWPEISTSVTTCLLTALTTIGASRQKQVLRFAGALIGGYVFGMGAQVFILPYIDSIAAFVVLFVAVAGAAAWVATSSPRLSYCGVQIAFAFFLINLEEVRIQTSLTVARDRVAGILLGLLVMWLVFDHLWSAPAGLAMKKAFVSGLRLLAQFTREPVSGDLRTAIERSYSLRETINAEFDKVRSLADGVLFEFGPERQRDLELRGFIRSFQPRLRALFLMRVASWKYRAQVPGFEFPESVRVRQAAYDERSAGMLEEMADRIEGQRPGTAGGLEDCTDLLKQPIEEAAAEQSRGLTAGQAQSFTALLRGIDGLTASLASEVAVEFAGP